MTEKDEITIPDEEEKERIFLMKLHLYVFESSKFPLHLRRLLENNNIKTIGDLVQKSEQDLLKIKQFGRKRLYYVNLTLGGIGLSLRIEETDEEIWYRRYKEKWEKRNK
jgi:DNA-directed RNA polymerase subunit alpha